MAINIYPLKKKGQRFHNIPTWKPTQSQESLLKAALFKGEEALKAWENWKVGVNIDKIDSGSQRLLPLVYKNLQNFQIEEDLSKLLKSVYKKTWFLNQIFLQNTAQVVQRMQDSDIPVILFKGIAMVLLYYQNPALRPMTDIDILVPREQAKRASDLLKSWGYTFDIPLTRPIFKENNMVFCNGIGFNNNSGFHLDLHWGLLKHSCFPGADDQFWTRSIPVKIKGIQALALTPEDQLLQVLEHGTYRSFIPSIRWIADTFFILNFSSGFDWQYFFNLAAKKYLLLPVREMLIFLKDSFDFPIPESKIHSIENYPSSNFGTKLYGYMKSPSNNIIRKNIQLYVHLVHLYQHYLREYKKVESSNFILSLIRFLQFRWDLKQAWLVPLFFPIQLFKKIYRFLDR